MHCCSPTIRKIRVGGIVRLFSWKRVVNAIMIRKVPKATMNTKEIEIALPLIQTGLAKNSTNLTVNF